MTMTKEVFATLPEEVQGKIKNTLRAYEKCNVEFYNGEYHVSTGVALLAVYPEDLKQYGTAYANDIYTENEQIENYINGFYEYPTNYNGERNYRELTEAQHNRKQGKLNAKGNFEWND